MATSSQHPEKYFWEEFSPANFSGWAEIATPVEVSGVYYRNTTYAEVCVTFGKFYTVMFVYKCELQ